MLDAGKREQGGRLRRVNQQIKIAVFGPGEEPGGGEAGARGATVHAAVRRAAAMTHTGGTAFAGLGLIVLWSTGLAFVLVWLERRPATQQQPMCGAVAGEAVFSIGTWIPHQIFGDPECGGFLYGIIRGAEGFIECNDCDAVIRTLPAADLRHALNEMESGLEIATEQCPHCGKVNLFPTFSKMMIYVCRECGEMVKLSDGPSSQ